jgi:hypothetical protein
LIFSKARMKTTELSFTFITRMTWKFDSSQSKQNLIVLTIKSWLLLAWKQNLLQSIILLIIVEERNKVWFSIKDIRTNWWNSINNEKRMRNRTKERKKKKKIEALNLMILFIVMKRSFIVSLYASSYEEMSYESDDHITLNSKFTLTSRRLRVSFL